MVTDGDDDDDGGGYLDDGGAASSRSTTMASLPPTLAVREWRRPDDSLFPSPPVIRGGDERRGHGGCQIRAGIGPARAREETYAMELLVKDRSDPSLPFIVSARQGLGFPCPSPDSLVPHARRQAGPPIHHQRQDHV